MNYLLFAGASNYANGGMGDFAGVFNAADSALAEAKTLLNGVDWFQIARSTDLKVIHYCPGTYCGSVESGDEMLATDAQRWFLLDGDLKKF